MKMSDEVSLPVSQDAAWAALNDVNLLRTCIPGCEAINLQEDGSYELVVAAAVGPIRARFKGEMRMLDVVAPTSYRLEFSMQGGAVGFGRGGAAMELHAIDAQTTMLKYTASANVGGKLAQIGARLIDITAKKMAAQFFEAFRKRLVATQPGAATQDQVDSAAADASVEASAADKAAPVGGASISAPTPHPATPPSQPTATSDNTFVIKIEVTLIDQTTPHRRSRLLRCWDALMGR